jgi:hypothetical protein
MITVIIATLADKNLNRLLHELNKEKFVKKIILSVPLNCNTKNFNFKTNKKLILYNSIRHQVKQRVAASHLVKTKFTLYLDDDVIFNNLFIKKLYKFKLLMGDKSVVGPIYYDLKKKKIHSLNGDIIFQIKKILLWILFGIPLTKKRMGLVTNEGLNFGVDPDYMENCWHEVGWLPGACILLNTEFLIKKNYFLTNGKAYCEDLILSFLFKKKKLQLFVSNKCKIYTEPQTKLKESKEISLYFKGLRNYYRIQNKDLDLIFVLRKIYFYLAGFVR